MRRARMLAVVAASLLAVGLVRAPSASALPEADFTPTLEISSSTYQAGGHPDLTIRTQKPHKCWSPTPWTPTNPNPCVIHTNPFFPDFVPSALEQDLKRQAVHFPPGLMADANAAPYCDPEKISRGAYSVWRCRDEGAREAARVGTVLITAQACGPGFAFVGGCPFGWLTGGSLRSNLPDVPPYATLLDPGLVYNARPRTSGEFAGEQGHLVVLWAQPYLQDGALRHGFFDEPPVKADISISVRESDAGIDAVVDNLPDTLPVPPPLVGGIPAQIVDLAFTIEGSTGTGAGHPVLTNPTSCDRQSIAAEYQGYRMNSVDFPRDSMGVHPNGQGDGKEEKPDPVPYQATGCDQIPYDPKLSFKLSENGPSQVPEISSTVTQDDDEAATKRVEVKFPKAFKINASNKATFCSAGDLGARSCPDSAKVGSVKADSRLLPEGTSLSGNVFLSGLEGDRVRFTALLSGFVNLRVDASGKIGPDGAITTVFDNLPAVPISRFDLRLSGGDQGLLKTPKTCGPETVEATFTSHSNKQVVRHIPLDIQGCKDPTIDVELTPRRIKSLADLDLRVNSNGIQLRQIELQLARHLKWGIRQKAQKSKASSAGALSLTSADGVISRSLMAQRTGSGNVRFTPATRQLGALSDLSATLFRTRRRQPSLTPRGKDVKTGKKRRRQADIVIVSGFPKEAITAAELELKGSRGSFFLKTPKGCKRPFNFVAQMVAHDGTKYVAHDALRLRGKGCRKR